MSGIFFFFPHIINFLSPLSVAVSMWKMGCQSGAVHWTPVRAQDWFSRPTARDESLSFTAQTRISTCRPRRCPETPRQPASCELSTCTKAKYVIVLSHWTVSMDFLVSHLIIIFIFQHVTLESSTFIYTFMKTKASHFNS